MKRGDKKEIMNDVKYQMSMLAQDVINQIKSLK